MSKDADLGYFTNSYGVFKNDGHGNADQGNGAFLQQTGMSAQDFQFLSGMKAKGKLVIVEFNALAPPTSPQIRSSFESLYGIKWTGWIGRYFDSFDSSKNKELPAWLIKDYRAQHKGVWPFKKGGIAFVHADSTGVGTNRRDPKNGPAHHDVPVITVRNPDTQKMLGMMLVGSMHPTVLHEDSTLVTADFPGFARKYLKDRYNGCPIVYHTGPCGNLSPRHVTSENTFKEAERLGTIMGSAVDRALAHAEFTDTIALASATGWITPVKRIFPSVAEADRHVKAADQRFGELKKNGTPQEARGAEVDMFGAHETLTLAKAEASGVLDKFRQARTPAEVQSVKIGPFFFAAWPCEVFVEYAWDLKQADKNAFVISMANGELQGYIVTEAAAAEGGYEASNALFAPETGKRLVAESLRLFNICFG